MNYVFFIMDIFHAVIILIMIDAIALKDPTFTFSFSLLTRHGSAN